SKRKDDDQLPVHPCENYSQGRHTLRPDILGARGLRVYMSTPPSRCREAQMAVPLARYGNGEVAENTLGATGRLGKATGELPRRPQAELYPGQIRLGRFCRGVHEQA
ncbi:unnamed protein product, partial [Ectocarpus fasciculatus]